MNRTFRLVTLGALAVFSAACGASDMAYKPAAQILPPHIRKLSVRPARNKTHQFGLEDKLTLAIRDEFLRDGRYSIVPEDSSDGIVQVTLLRYILTPTQYDAVLTPIAYKLQVVCDLHFIDRTTNTILWEEKNMEGIHVFGAQTVRGGKTEEQAREFIWELLAKDVRTRTLEGFGSVTGGSSRATPRDPPPNQPEPQLPNKPVNPNPY